MFQGYNKRGRKQDMISNRDSDPSHSSPSFSKSTATAAVKRHYTRGGGTSMDMENTILAALNAGKNVDQQLTVDDLAPIDELHALEERQLQILLHFFLTIICNQISMYSMLDLGLVVRLATLHQNLAAT